MSGARRFGWPFLLGLWIAGCAGDDPLGPGSETDAGVDPGTDSQVARADGVETPRPDGTTRSDGAGLHDARPVSADAGEVPPPEPSYSLDCAKNPGLLHPIFGDHMVLQRSAWVPIWGCAPAGSKLTVSFAGQKVSGTADAKGLWRVRLRPMTAGGPYQLVVSGAKSWTLSDVMVGDVWLCSGQSNMAMAVSGVKQASKEIADAANYPKLRLFTVPRWASPAPTQVFADLASWTPASPTSIPTFSATCYFFARELYKKIPVPMGLINSSVGGTRIEWWMSKAALAKDPDLAQDLAAAAKTPAGNQKANYANVTLLYNGMIAPLLPFTVGGVVWYQGESNATLPAQYQRLLPGLIKDWRSRWSSVWDVPFLVVQLPRYQAAQTQPSEGGWAGLREAQLLTSRKGSRVGLAITIDTGEATNIHPQDKQDVGSRLALVARGVAYQALSAYSGPLYKSYKVQGNKIVVSFDHASSGLMVGTKLPLQAVKPDPGGQLKGFAIAGANKTFVWATATISGSTVVVAAPSVTAPVAVRYGWANNPPCNLYNKDGLPASPFRTDSW